MTSNPLHDRHQPTTATPDPAVDDGFFIEAGRVCVGPPDGSVPDAVAVLLAGLLTVTRAQRQVVEALVAGESAATAAVAAGVSEQTVLGWERGHPGFRAELARCYVDLDALESAELRRLRAEVRSEIAEAVALGETSAARDLSLTLARLPNPAARRSSRAALDLLNESLGNGMFWTGMRPMNHVAPGSVIDGIEALVDLLDPRASR